MSRSLGAELPGAVQAALSSADLASLHGLTILLLTTTPDGWPHLAMLSVGEVVAMSSREVRLALWPQSTATDNLTANGQAMLALVLDGAGYYVRVQATRRPDLHLRTGRLAYFTTVVAEVLEDRAPYAELRSGITYALKDPDGVFPRWQATVAAVRAAPAA
jgi:hypothetical protein